MQDRAQNTRKKILAAAEWEFSEKGLYGARVDDIARAAGVNKSMLYAYSAQAALVSLAKPLI